MWKFFLESFGDRATRHSKRRLFLIILAVLAVAWLVTSLFTKVTFIADREEDFVRFAVAGPMSGAEAAIGRSMRQGAKLYLETVNEAGGVEGTRFALDVFDDADLAEGAAKAAAEIAASTRIAGVIGHWSSAASLAAGRVYAERGVPAITPASVDPKVVADNEWHFATLANDERQSRFIANYIRNVMGQKLVSLVEDRQRFGATMARNFEDTLGRFGTTVRYTWGFDGTEAGLEARLDGIVKELQDKVDAGTLFLAMGGQEGALFLRKLRDAGVRNPVVGPNFLATTAFAERLADLAKQADKDPATYTNQMLVAAPLLFDTANEAAQDFRTRYRKAHGEDPDWVAAYAYDSARLLVEARRRAEKSGQPADITGARKALRQALADIKEPEKAVDGVSGPGWFDAKGEAQKPVLIGVYSGRNIVSALTQLQPIKADSNTNYIEELKQGRVLYVNDRFMYKTNVVYTGLQLNEISEIDTTTNQATLSFLIWFRYRGDIQPQDLTFTNAVEPIELEDPVDERTMGDMTYRLYRVKGKFNLDFTDTNRAYGSHVVGVSFSHNRLNRNNLLYVVDVLGIGLTGQAGMLEKVQEIRALSPTLGWNLDKAWISQDVVAKGTRGDPTYVGFGATDPDFSKIDLGVLIKKAVINARDFIPGEYFIYIGLLGLLGTVFAILMDRKEKGRFWSAQSWGMRVVAWPMALLAGGNLALDIAFANLSVQYIDVVVIGYEMLWWLVPARLIGIALERFLWRPLEDHTERNIPNVVRVFASVLIYTFAGFGIVAFVFGQQLTSLLASTGLLAMIIGLAIQTNISNIFSGIVLNIERPFGVGDWVRIGDMDEGRVIDITWRTTRVKTRNGYVVSLPNGQVSESHVHNFNSFDSVRLELQIYLDACIEPEEALAAMMMGLEKADQVLDRPEREVRFKGIKWQMGWIAEYEIQFWIADYGPREEIAEGVLGHVYKSLRDHGLSIQATGGASHPPIPDPRYLVAATE